MDVEMIDGAQPRVLLSSLSPGTPFCVGNDALAEALPCVFIVVLPEKGSAPKQGYRWAMRVESGGLCEMSLEGEVQPLYARLSVWLNRPDDNY